MPGCDPLACMITLCYIEHQLINGEMRIIGQWLNDEYQIVSFAVSEAGAVAASVFAYRLRRLKSGRLPRASSVREVGSGTAYSMIVIDRSQPTWGTHPEPFH